MQKDEKGVLYTCNWKRSLSFSQWPKLKLKRAPQKGHFSGFSHWGKIVALQPHTTHLRTTNMYIYCENLPYNTVMRSSLSILTVVWIISCATAQFGVAQKKDAGKIEPLLQQPNKENDLVEALLEVANSEKNILKKQDAVDLAVMLEQAAKDPDTLQMALRIQTEEKETIEELRATASIQDVMMGLNQVLGELKMLEVVFEDKEQALRLMQEEGMIDPNRLPEYQKNPALLEDDTRKGLYFTFVTLAVTAGFL